MVHNGRVRNQGQERVREDKRDVEMKKKKIEIDPLVKLLEGFEAINQILIDHEKRIKKLERDSK